MRAGASTGNGATPWSSWSGRRSGRCHPAATTPGGSTGRKVSAGIGPNAMSVTSSRWKGSLPSRASARKSAPRSASRASSTSSAPAPTPRHDRCRALRAGARDRAQAPCGTPRHLGRPGGLEPVGADERDRVEEKCIRRGRRPALLLRLVRDGAPVGVPHGPARAVSHLIALPGLHACRLLPVPRRALECKGRRASRLVGRRMSRPCHHDLPRGGPEASSVSLGHEAVEGGRAAPPVCPLDHHQPRRAGALSGVVEQLEDLAEGSHPAILPTGRSHMLFAPARGDRPATTDRRWQTSSPISSPRLSTTSWPRRAACGPRAPGPRHLLAEGLRPADDALPRRLWLLHLRAAAAARRARLPDRGRGARDRPGRGGGGLHARRSSRSATGRSSATASHVTSSPRSAARRRSSTSPAARGACSTRPGLLPHLNPGVMTRDELAALRPVAASMGIMLETTAERLAATGRAALGLARQGAGAPARDDPSRGRARDPVHERDPRRDR